MGSSSAVLLGEAIKTARVARGWSQARLAEVLHRSPSTVSRWETGAQRLTDVEDLRVVADVLRIPYEDLGLAPTGDSAAKDDDPVRRRQLLRNFAVAAAASAAPGGLAGVAGAKELGSAPGELLVGNLRDALLGSMPSVSFSTRSQAAQALARANQG
ncbi:XRE family transcriptional regulator [Actinomadura sp. KC216]|nr:XRE family transcriptional regulator [Actinomadura sp. KC216]